MRDTRAVRRKPKPSKRRQTATAPVARQDHIQNALDYIREQITTGKLRPTIADLIRLLEIRQAQAPNDILACWYSPNTPEGTCPVCLRPSDPRTTARLREILRRQQEQRP